MIAILGFLLFCAVICVNGSPLHELRAGSSLHFAEVANKDSTAELNLYRSSDEVVPQSYELDIVPDIESAFTFKGTVKIEVQTVFTTRRITLNSKNLRITRLSVSHKDEAFVTRFYEKPEYESVIINVLNKNLDYNNKYEIIIDFEGKLGEENFGFYRSSYKVDGKVKWLAITQFQPTYARMAFPCFDDPKFRTPFRINLSRMKTQQKSATNMPSTKQAKELPHFGDRVWDSYDISVPMPTYLVAFMVSEYDVIALEENKYNIWVRENAKSSAKYSLRKGREIFKKMEQFVGVPYGLPKFDMVAVPDFKAGAMENWGLTTFKESLLLIEQEKHPEIAKRRSAQIIAHEISHQWFGNHVTPLWWDYLWLSEAFATYFEYYLLAESESQWNLGELFIVEKLHQALLLERWNNKHPMTTQVKTVSQIENIFDGISYEKGGSIIRMLEHIITTPTFKSALHHYLVKGHKKGGSVTPDDLWEAFDKQINRDLTYLPPKVNIKTIMKSWTENSGYPLISVMSNKETSRVTIEQSPYRISDPKASASDLEWIVPVTCTTKSRKDFADTKPKLWLFPNEVFTISEEIKFVEDEWILCNIQQTGYYRVNYDTENWERIIKQLIESPADIHLINRAQLIDDSFMLAYDDKVPFDLPFRLIRYMEKETEMVPWLSALVRFKYMFNYHQTSSVENELKTFLLNLLTKQYERLGFQRRNDEDKLVKSEISKVVYMACRLGHTGCIENALAEYQKHRTDLSKIQPDMKPVVYCIYLKHAKDEVERETAWNELWTLYKATDSDYDRDILLSSFACVENEKLVKRLLNKLFDATDRDIRLHQQEDAITTSLYSPPGVLAGLNVIKERINDTNVLDDKALTILLKITQHLKYNVKTDEQIKLVEEIITDTENLPAEKAKKYQNLIRTVQRVKDTSYQEIKNLKSDSETLRLALKCANGDIESCVKPKVPELNNSNDDNVEDPIPSNSKKPEDKGSKEKAKEPRVPESSSAIKMNVSVFCFLFLIIFILYQNIL